MTTQREKNKQINIYIYNNVTSVGIFIGCWPRSIKGHTQMASNPRQITSANLFFFFHAPKILQETIWFLLYKTNRQHFSVCVYCNRSQKTSQRVKSTHTRKNVIYMLNINTHRDEGLWKLLMPSEQKQIQNPKK